MANIVNRIYLPVLSGLLLVMSLLLAACSDDNKEAERVYDVVVTLNQSSVVKVDILFVVDNSGSMEREQNVLSEQIVVMTHELVAPSDHYWGSATVVEDLRLGVVSTDMGVGGYDIDVCAGSERGDDGVMQNVGRRVDCEESYSSSDCSREECPWLHHSIFEPDDGSDPMNPPIWEDFGCIATLGTEGCAFEQQLEAARRALVDQTMPGRPNEGFLREDSLLTIFFITDEDDCSAANTDFFDPDATDLDEVNIRCATNSEHLHSIEWYYDAFTGLRPDNEDRVVVAAITGVPIDGSWNPGDPLEALRDLQRVRPDNPNELIPSCDTYMGMAYPPVRLAELVYRFGNNGMLESICEEDWTGALQAVTRKIQKKLSGVCIESEPFITTDDSICRMVELLDDDRPCPNPVQPAGAGADRTMGWHVDLGIIDVDGTSRRRCQILPADYDGDECPDGAPGCLENDYTGGLDGWFYERNDPDCQWGIFLFSFPQLPEDGSSVSYECRSDR